MLSSNRLRRHPRQAAGMFTAVLFVTSILAAPATALAQPPSESATSESAGPVGRAAETLNPMNWSLPKLRNPGWKMPNFGSILPGQSDQERIVKKKNSLMDDVSSTAKKSWQRTKEALNPQKFNPMNLFAPPERTVAKKSDDSPGFFQSLFQPPQEPAERVANVNDFLGQPRPGL